MYTWLQFTEAIDALLLTNAQREGTQTGKALKVRMGAKKMQETTIRYRNGHQDLYTYSDLIPNGFASEGELPEDCEPRDCYIVGRIILPASNTVDTVNDQITVSSHGITAPTAVIEVQWGKFFNTGGSLPGGVVSNQTYFLRVVDANTLTLHTSAQGVIDNTGRVTLTGDGSGTTNLEYSYQRYRLNDMEWGSRYSMTNGQVCIDPHVGLISFNPNDSTFLVYPQLSVGADDNNRTWQIEINWDGVKLEWDDNDPTPFDDAAVEAIAAHVQTWFHQYVDQDLQQAAFSQNEFKNARADAYLKAKRQGETRS